MSAKGELTTISIDKESLDYITDLQYILKKKAIGKFLTKQQLTKLIVDFIRHKEEEFVEFVKNNYSVKSEVD